MNTRMLRGIRTVARRLALTSAVALAVGGIHVKAAPGEVLILAASVTGGLGSPEAAAVVSAGKTPVLASDATWRAMTGADFAAYDALVIGDPTCETCVSCYVQAAVDTAAVWGPVLSGNVIIIGSDPVYHVTYGPGAGPARLIKQGIAFAVAEAGKTGGYLDLSCYYHFSGSGTPVPLLDGVSGGGFKVIGGSYTALNDVHIVAAHPALAGLTDADLSNWGNSVHEAFTTWPVQFEVLAIARDSSGSHTAPDGTVGFPYILARGESLVVISDITLEPRSAVNAVGTSHTVVATVKEDGEAKPGVTVDFEVIAGPHTGTGGSAVTDVAGQASFTYTGTTAGEDFIQASFTDSLGRRQSSNKATKEWTSCGPPTAQCTPSQKVSNLARYYRELTAESSCFGCTELELWVGDTGSAQVVGPFKCGDVVRVSKSATASAKPGKAGVAAIITVVGQAEVWATDPDDRTSDVVICP